MKGSSRTLIVGILAAVVLFVGVYALYHKLSGEYGLQTVPDSVAGEVTSTDQPGTVSDTESQQKVYPAPDFIMLDAEGEEVSLSDFFGKPIVLNFWASWCPPCKAELPDFDKVCKERKDIQFIMLNVADGQSETVASAKKYIEGEGYSFPVYFDTMLEGSSKYGASSIPMTFFINAKGEVVTYASGMIDEQTLLKAIDMIDD